MVISMKSIAVRRMLALLAACALTAGLLTACGNKTEDNSSQEGSETMSSDSLSSAEETVSGTESPPGMSGDTTEPASGTTTDGGPDAPGTTTAPTDPPDASELEEEIAFYQEILNTETQWLASMQLDNGALPMTAVKDGNVTMNPYFADFAALGILEGDSSGYAVVKKYMDWHFAHLNTAETDYNGVDGTIYDYTLTVSGGKVTKEEVIINDQGKKSYDSTDSYAATFLCVLWKYSQKSGDNAYIVSHAAEIRRIINAMYATMDNDLTMAKPDYQVKYLMDNCEVYEGLAAAVHLYEDVLAPGGAGDAAMLSRLKADKQKVADAIEEQMWNNAGYYEAGLFKDGSVAYAFSWDSFYPCATAQLFPVICGLISPDSARAQNLYDSFNRYYSTGATQHSWEQMSIPGAFYWCSLVQAGALMGDEARVKTYMTNYKKVMRTHAYPLYNAEAGRACLAASIMLQRLKAQL